MSPDHRRRPATRGRAGRSSATAGLAVAPPGQQAPPPGNGWIGRIIGAVVTIVVIIVVAAPWLHPVNDGAQKASAHLLEPLFAGAGDVTRGHASTDDVYDPIDPLGQH